MRPRHEPLAITEKVFGPDHPGVNRALNDLAGVYFTPGRIAEAEPLLNTVTPSLRA